MIALDNTLDVPATARYHREAIEQIAQCVEERIYCALLGPRLCGKTLLLRFIEQNLAKLAGWTCVYVDLLELRATTQQAFFADLTRLTAGRLSDLTELELPFPEEEFASSAVFRGFLLDSLDFIQRDVVLLIDPLEALPTDLVQALLTSLRAAYMDQQTLENQVTVVISGALSLATLTVGESSPFRGIARRVFIGDLSEDQSHSLILDLLSEHNVSTTKPALQRLVSATSGDTYLIRRISQSCAERVLSRSSDRLNSRDVHYTTQHFLRDEVFQYAPLLEAIRLIEEDPDLLQCILMLLEHGSVLRSDLPLPLSPDLDPLYLTGVVERFSGDRYRLQNSIYRQFLLQHFVPGRVGHVLAMAGRWDSAIDYLEYGIADGDRQSRTDVLPAVINSIYASQDLSQAVHFLRRGLSVAFGLREALIWYASTQDTQLRLIGPADLSMDTETHIHIHADRLEARAYRQQIPLRGQEGEQRVVRAIPLRIPGESPIGVVIIHDDLVGDLFIEQRERELQLVGFLNQAARALQEVSIRRQELALAGRMQTSLLPVGLPEVPGWQLAATWRPARETSGDFYDFISLPDGRLGIVIADVVDKGMGAALLMAMSRTLIRTYAGEYPDNPEQVLHHANQRLLADMDAGMFVTVFYGILDPSTGTLNYCNAGHPPPYLLVDNQENILEPLLNTGIPIGISEDVRWTPVQLNMPPGALLLLYTDGVIDAQNQGKEFFGDEGLRRAIQSRLGRPAREIQDAVIAGVYAFAGVEPQIDDITLMVLVRNA